MTKNLDLKNFAEKFTYFFFAIRHKHVEFLKAELLKYIDSNSLYLICPEVSTKSHEDTEGQHIHLAVEISKVGYNNFTKKIKEHWGLRGVAKKDEARQYGKVKKVKKPIAMMSYTLKEQSQHTLTSNIDYDLLSPFKELSYQADKGETNFQNPWLLDIANHFWDEHQTAVLTYLHYINKPEDKELQKCFEKNNLEMKHPFHEAKKTLIATMMMKMSRKHKKLSAKILMDEINGALNILVHSEDLENKPENWANLVYNFIDHFVQTCR